LCSEEQSVAGGHNAIALMKKRLPDYVVNCLMKSGYDKIGVLCSIDISEGPKDTIAKIERFINRKYSNIPDYNPDLSTPF